MELRFSKLFHLVINVNVGIKILLCFKFLLTKRTRNILPANVDTPDVIEGSQPGGDFLLAHQANES